MGLYRDNGKEHGSYYIVYWGYIGINVEDNRNYYVTIGYILLNGTENGNYYGIIGCVCICINVEENGNYHVIIGYILLKGRENGNYYVMIGYVLFNGKENGNYYALQAPSTGRTAHPGMSSGHGTVLLWWPLGRRVRRVGTRSPAAKGHASCMVLGAEGLP